MTEKISRKDQILDIASRLFFEQGYHSTGIKQIIDAAEIAKGTFYCHFKSKEELGLEWLKRGHQRWIEERDRLMQEAGDDPEAKTIALFDFLSDGSVACNYRGCAFINTLAETPELDCPMRCAIQEIKREFLSFIRSLVDEKIPDAPEEDREQRAGAIYLLFEGATVAAQSFCKTGPIEIARKQVRLILQEPVKALTS